MRNCKNHWQHCVSCHLLLHLGLILIPRSQSIAAVNNSFTQWHFPLFLGRFEKNIVNNLLFEYLKNACVCDFFPFKLL